jgi:hypothetical protein
LSIKYYSFLPSFLSRLPAEFCDDYSFLSDLGPGSACGQEDSWKLIILNIIVLKKQREGISAPFPARKRTNFVDKGEIV